MVASPGRFTTYRAIDSDRQFSSNYGRALGYALAGLRRPLLGRISGIWQL